MADSDFSSGSWNAYTINRGNASPGSQYHLGKALTLSGSNYAYHADNNIFDIGGEDIIFSGWYKGTDTDGYLFSKNRNSARGYGLFNNSGCVVVVDGANRFKGDSTTNVSDNLWHFFLIILDESAHTVYVFIDGIYVATATRVTTLGNNTADFVIGGQRTTGDSDGFSITLIGQYDEIMLYRFGANGLYVSGTVGTNGVIRVGTSGGPLIWSDTDSENLVKRLHYSPYSTLTKLGYSSIDDADRTDLVTNGDMEAAVAVVNGTSVGVAVGTGAQSTDQANDGVKSYKYTGDGGTSSSHYFLYRSSANYVLGDWYEFICYIYIPSGNTQLTSFTLRYYNSSLSKFYTGTTVTATDTWTKASVVFKAFNDTPSYIQLINSATQVTSESAYFDSYELKKVGLVARWKMNGDLTDESFNGLDLTGVNDPTYSDNTYINPLMYNSINPHTGTISFWITPDWDGNDGTLRYIYRDQVDANNYFYIAKTAANNLDFVFTNNSTTNTCSYDISDWINGTSYHVACVWSVHTIDGTDYLHLYVNGAEVDNIAVTLGNPQGVEENMDFGQYDKANKADAAIQNFRISHLPYKATITTAEAAGFPQDMSVEYLYNNGTPLLNEVCDEYTGCLIIED